MTVFVAVDAIPFIPGAVEPPTPVPAAYGVAGIPGSWLPSGSVTPANLAALSTVIAEPTTAWTVGQYVRLGDHSLAHWNGTAWAAGAASTPPPTTGRLLVDYATPGWAAEWMTGSDERARYTAAIMTEIAQRYDVIAGYEHLKQWVPVIRQANPNSYVVMYQLGPFANLTEAGMSPSTTLPELMFAHTGATAVAPDWTLIAEDLAAPGARHGHGDLNKDRTLIMRAHKGNRIMTNEPFKTFLMDAGNTSWQQESAQRALRGAALQGGHGVLLDSMGVGAMRVPYVDGAPWNRASGAPYSGTEWAAQSAQQVRTVRSVAPGFFVAINGLGAYEAYDQTKVIGYEADLAMAERTVRDPHHSLTAFPNSTETKGTIDMMIDAETNSKVGGGFAWCSKLWTTPDATAAEQKIWHEVCQAIFMLGTSGKSRYFFIKDGDAPAKTGGVGGSILTQQPSPVLSIGTPTQGYQQTGSLFHRQFTNGVVTYNASSAAITHTIPSGTYRRSDNDQLFTGTSVSVPSFRGLILTKQ